ncbi:glutamate-rich protein 6-like isoform X2 [Littorina saxatilis]|uniref:glutamate-rich protein 6-like isoform X2 n=1 Tax=Littorina saxatilis TaxID=31220 RepID=UPI0038B4EEFD
MEAIRPTQSGSSQQSSHSKSDPASRGSVTIEVEGEKEATQEGNGYASDTESEDELIHTQQQQAEDADSSSSRGSSAEGQPKSRNTTGKDSRTSISRVGRSAHSVSFSRAKSRVTEKRMTYDGREITLVTLNTQTDWDWLENAEHTGKAKILIPTDVKPESRETTSRPRTELGASSAADSRAETDYTPFSLQPNDEYGIPLLEMSSTSDDSSDEDAPKKKRAPRVSLPSVGPPQILKYIRESAMKTEPVEEAPVSGEVDEVDLPLDEDGNPLGMYAGPCEFCSSSILPLPTLEQQTMQDPASLYCCEDYREFIQFATNTVLRMEQDAQKATQKINIKVHPHHGSKQARRAAKERAVERMRQREMVRRQQEAIGTQANFYSSGGSSGAPASGAQSRPAQMSLKPATLGGGGGGGGMFKDMATLAGLRSGQATQGPMPHGQSILAGQEARQMKTINYQLSSQRCLEEGWTIRPPSPLGMEDADMEVFVPEPLHPAMIATGNVRDRPLVEKYYPKGNKFLTMFPDGTGNVFYPSGRLAVMVTSVTLGQYTYIVLDDTPDAHILAMFDPHGYGTVYFLNGNVKLYYDQYMGIELDMFGARKRRWQWKDQETHVHAPPFQPICLRLNHHGSVRVMAQEAVALTFMASKRSVRFSVGARLKLVAPQNIPRKEIDEHQLIIDERKAQVENILSKVSALLKFPKSPKVDKILPPLHVTSKMMKAEKMRKELSASVRGSTEVTKPSKGKTASFPPVSVN